MKKSRKDFSFVREQADTDLLTLHRELAGTPEEWWHFSVLIEVHLGGQSQLTLLISGYIYLFIFF